MRAYIISPAWHWWMMLFASTTGSLRSPCMQKKPNKKQKKGGNFTSFNYDPKNMAQKFVFKYF